MGARLAAMMPAEYADFQLGGGPWYGYWYGVIPQVVEGASTGFDFGGREESIALEGHQTNTEMVSS